MLDTARHGTVRPFIGLRAGALAVLAAAGTGAGAGEGKRALAVMIIVSSRTQIHKDSVVLTQTPFKVCLRQRLPIYLNQ